MNCRSETFIRVVASHRKIILPPVPGLVWPGLARLLPQVRLAQSSFDVVLHVAFAVNFQAEISHRDTESTTCR